MLYEVTALIIGHAIVCHKIHIPDAKTVDSEAFSWLTKQYPGFENRITEVEVAQC